MIQKNLVANSGDMQWGFLIMIIIMFVFWYLAWGVSQFIANEVSKQHQKQLGGQEKTVAYLMELQKKKDAAIARKAPWGRALRVETGSVCA